MTLEFQLELAGLGWHMIVDLVEIIVSAFASGWLLLMTFMTLRYLDIQSWRSPQSVLSACCVFILFLSFLELLSEAGIFLAGLASIAGFISTSNTGLNFLFPWPQAASVIVVDGIVLWRAWVMFLNSKLWRCLALIIMAANIAISITYCIVSNIDNINESILTGGNMFSWLMIVSSLLVNMFATISIYWKTRVLIRNVAAALPKRTYIQKILFLLIESGATFCGLQLLGLICSLLVVYGTNPPFSLIFFMITGNSIYTSMAVVWYPTAVIILVKTKNSFIEQSIHYSHSMAE